MVTKDGRVRIMVDVPPELKVRIDKKVHWGLRNHFLSAVLDDVVSGLESDDKGILVGLIVAGKIHITWDVEGVLK